MAWQDSAGNEYESEHERDLDQNMISGTAGGKGADAVSTASSNILITIVFLLPGFIAKGIAFVFSMIGRLGFAVLLTTALFTMTACEGGVGGPGGGGGIPVKVRAFNNEGNEPLSRSLLLNRAVGGEDGRGGLVRAVEDPSFDVLNDIYDLAEDPPVCYTPTRFYVHYQMDAILSDGTVTEIAPEQPYDFTKGLTVDVGDIPKDITVSGLILRFASVEGNPVEFTKGGSTVTEDAAGLGMIPDNGGLRSLHTFVCYGNDRKFTSEAIQDIVPGSTTEEYGPSPKIVIPFEPKSISSDTSSVTLNISWDLTNIVADYGEDFINYYGGNGYIFKQGWWNSLYVNASVQ